MSAPTLRREQHPRVSQDHISGASPMGAHLIADGASFRVWAPGAHKVFVIGDFNAWTPDDDSLLERHTDGRWTGFIPDFADGSLYKFWVEGDGSAGPKRDPYARELE